VADEQPGRLRRRRRDGATRRETRLQRAERISDAYGLVLFLILVTFVVTMTLPQEGKAGRVAAIAASALTSIVALTSSDVRAARVRLAASVSAVAIVLAVLGVAIPSDPLLGAAFLAETVLLAVAAVTILRRVIGAIDVDFRTILGAISVFTMLGLLFSSAYLALARFQSGEVFTGVSNPRSSDFLFFSYTTLTTTGYGNLVPAGVVGQSIAVFEMLIGQIFLVTLVAGLVSLWRPGSKLPADEKRG
jgi:voltage-gated potassium channel Kch